MCQSRSKTQKTIVIATVADQECIVKIIFKDSLCAAFLLFYGEKITNSIGKGSTDFYSCTMLGGGVSKQVIQCHTNQIHNGKLVLLQQK